MTEEEIRFPHIITQTDRWVVVSKPPRWHTIPSPRPSADPVLLPWLQTQVGKTWTVHRLDFNTSGILLFAKDAASHSMANHWFAKHQVRKEYECIAKGKPDFPSFRIDAPVNGKSARTLFELKEQKKDYVWLKARPLTGRRHQIRMHLSFKKHPVLGDVKYGGDLELELSGKHILLSRHYLHSTSLKLPTGELFESPIPDDWIKLWEQFP